jgi:hypothetical protein
VGGVKQKPFFTGAMVLQPPEAMDAFVRMGATGNEFIYAEAPEEPRNQACWSKAAELGRGGLVRTHQRRRPGGGWQFYLVRTSKPLPRETSPEEKALSDRATAAIFVQLKREANLGLPCSSNAELARLAGLSMRQQAGNCLRKLIDAGLVESTLAYEGGVPTRVIRILPSRYAGPSADKETALPKKWAALRASAARDAGAAR